MELRKHNLHFIEWKMAIENFWIWIMLEILSVQVFRLEKFNSRINKSAFLKTKKNPSNFKYSTTKCYPEFVDDYCNC